MGPSDLKDQMGFPSRSDRQWRLESVDPMNTLSPTIAAEDLTAAPVLKVQSSAGFSGKAPSARPVSWGLPRNMGQSAPRTADANANASHPRRRIHGRAMLMMPIRFAVPSHVAMELIRVRTKGVGSRWDRDCAVSGRSDPVRNPNRVSAWNRSEACRLVPMGGAWIRRRGP